MGCLNLQIGADIDRSPKESVEQETERERYSFFAANCYCRVKGRSNLVALVIRLILPMAPRSRWRSYRLSITHVLSKLRFGGDLTFVYERDDNKVD